MGEIRHSVCSHDCPDACSVLVTVEGETATRIRGNPDHPVTKGFLCGKVARYLEREYSPLRLTHPLKRTGAKGEGRFEAIGWDDALDEIALRLKSLAAVYGPESILPYSYGGTMGYLQGSGMDRRFFHRLGASRLDRTICATAGAAALTESLGIRLGTDPEQFPQAKLIVAWGANIHGTNIHHWPFIVEARRKGARLYTIDPVMTRTATLADRHFPINPGSDLALALGILHVIFEEGLEDRDYLERYTDGVESLRIRAADYGPERVEGLTGIGRADIVMLARELATTQPALIRANYGLQRSQRGGRAMQAISLIPAVTGAWRHAGGGFNLTTSGGFQLNRDALEMPELQQKALGREARLLNMTLLGQVLNDVDDPPVKAMIVYNSNPAAIAPQQNRVVAGLRREDLFTVVMEQFPTDTTDYADIVLPATTFLEHTDLYFAYGHYHLQLARPALPAPGEARPNTQVFRDLAARMGFVEPCFQDSDDDMIRSLLSTEHPFLSGITLERLDREHSIRLNVAAEGDPFLPFAQGGFQTTSGRCNLDAAALDYEPPVESRHGDRRLRDRFPLELVSSKNDDSMNSTFGYRPDVDEQTARLTIHPDDAAVRGIRSGDAVALFNERGRCQLTAHVDAGVRPGVVRAPSVRWNKSSPGGVGVNVLTSDRLTDIGGGATFYNCLVQLERCSNGLPA